MEGNGFIGLNKKHWNTKITASCFRIDNYIVGIPVANLVPMTIGANGVKIYKSIDYAI